MYERIRLILEETEVQRDRERERRGCFEVRKKKTKKKTDICLW